VTTFLPSDSVVRDQLDWGQLGWVSRPETTGAEQLVVLDVVLTPGGCHDFHKHPDQEEVLFLVSGTIEQWVGEEKQMLSAGDAAFIPKDTVHASFNDGAEGARLLAILGPCVGEAGYALVDVSSEEPWASKRA
jgi:quercetin dioxygenase-like cupin family protein